MICENCKKIEETISNMGKYIAQIDRNSQARTARIDEIIQKLLNKHQSMDDRQFDAINMLEKLKGN